MSKIENLFEEKAIEKLQKLIAETKTCLFCTDLTSLPISTRPMASTKVDDLGNLWFISSSQSNKNFEIKADNRVQLFYTNTNESEFLSIYGNAQIFKDKVIIEKLWSPIAKAWFDEGKKDPNVSVICVKPSDVHYWDNKNGKIISLLKIATQAATGIKMDIGREGDLKF